MDFIMLLLIFIVSIGLNIVLAIKVSNLRKMNKEEREWSNQLLKEIEESGWEEKSFTDEL